MLPDGSAWVAWVVALLIYPGGGFALALAGGMEAVRAGVAAGLARRNGQPPPAGPRQAARTWWRTSRPGGASGSAWGWAGQVALTLAGVLAPLAALVLLPLPGHPLAGGAGVGPVGDGLAVWALLLAGGAAHGVLGLGAAAPGAQLAGARRLQGLVLIGGPATLALMARATSAHSLQLASLNAGAGPAVLDGAGLVSVLTGLALLVTLPGLAGWPPADVTGVRPGPVRGDSILAGLPAPLPVLVWGGALLQRAAWVATLVVLLVPGCVAGGGPDAAIRLAAGLIGATLLLVAWGARRLPPRPDRVSAWPWALGLPLAAVALILALITT